MEDYSAIITENNRRKDISNSPYDPYTGLGSPIERVSVSYYALGELWEYTIPVKMYDDFKNTFDPLVAAGSVEELLKQWNKPVTPDTVYSFIKGLAQERFKYDFEFWAATTVKIQDKVSKKIIPFRSNRPQRKLLKVLEGMRMAGVPIRTIIVKARQWGGSTLVQIYMAWMQLIHETNWHSAIIADVNDQARNIRGMYSRLAKEFPKKIGTITFTPYEGSQNVRVIKEIGCIVGVASMQNPDALRSYDFAMLHLCVAPGTLIPTEDGFLKEVENLSVLDKIITHTGKQAGIATITKSVPSIHNGNGKAIEIQPWLGRKTVLTPNHPVFTNRGWVSAGNLKRDDLLSMPVREITNEITHITLPTSQMRKQGGGNLGSANGKTIVFDKEMGYFFGYYLAEGSLHFTKVGPKEIQLSRHDKEVRYGDRAISAVRHLISSHYRYKRPGTLTTIETLYSSVLAKYIDVTLGVKETKRIPDWFFKCGRDFLLGILQGYLSGDGSKTNNKQGKYDIVATSACTVSSSLAMQIRDIAASLGLGWAAIEVRDAGYWYGRNCKKIYNVRWSGISAKNVRNAVGFCVPDNGRPRSEKTFIKDGYVWMKIRSISEITVKYVYDIEVSHPDHSFRTLSFSVKNSEVGLWKTTEGKSPEDLAQGAITTVPDEPHTMITLESTAKGVGNYFHRQWQAAEKGETEYTPLFVAWHEIERYQKPIKDPQRFIKSIKEDKYAMFLWDCGATLEGINWYFTYKKAKHLDDWRMKSEMPSTANEAFQSTGHRVFAQQYVLAARKNCMPPDYIGEIYSAAQKGKDAFKDIVFKAEDRGCFKVWAMPDTSVDVSNRYQVVVDIGGRTDEADWSVIKVVDRYWMIDGGPPEVVAVWRGHMDQDLIAWKAAVIGKWYNNALVVVEVNSLDSEGSEGEHHLTVLDEIVPFYDNMYGRTDPEKIKQGIPIKYGFHTNRSTKPMVIDELNGTLREEGYVERDELAADEMDTYEIKSDGSYGATEGCHDDNVMVTAIGSWVCFKFLPRPALIKKSMGSKTNRIVSEASL